MGLERRGRVRWSCFAKQLDDRMTSIDTTNKPFMIEKRQVYEAYKAVKSNRGAAGIGAKILLAPTRRGTILGSDAKRGI